MAKTKGKVTAKANSVYMVEEAAEKIAAKMGLELVEVVLQKESRGKVLSVFIDKDGGISLDDCEQYHRTLQPLLDDVDYDIMEVSSPGVDRPIKNQRDFEKNRDNLVEVKLFAAQNGSKLYMGLLKAFDEEKVVIQPEGGEEISFQRKAVAIVKPVIQFEDEDLPEIGEITEDEFSEMELE
ncbi:MAG: ribosome maturation factor RimP [Oscillospiraceae bacterium]|nr:ribosome maturation factor RimP [Clostridia bacterium]MBR6738164.1 ribosome maturation factor RimP [Oscillospiraceae bacterium]